MEEQKTGKGFIVFLIFILIGLFVYLIIHNNWFDVNYYLSDVPNFDTNVGNIGIQNKDLSFAFTGIPEYLTVGEYTNLTVEVINNGEIFKNYTGAVVFFLKDDNGNYFDPDYCVMPNNGRYDFKLTDKGRKIFENGLKIDKVGKYTLLVESLFEEGPIGSFDIVVQDEVS